MRSIGLVRFLLLFAVTLGLSATMSFAEAAKVAQARCDELAVTQAKARFIRLREARRVDSGSVSPSEFQAVAARYIELAEACYQERYGQSGKAPTSIDQGGVWMGGVGNENFFTFGTKWGAGSPFPGGQDVAGPGIPGGVVT